MHAELIEKPVIIAICGKSAAGKDTLATFLVSFFTSAGFFAHKMVSATTRPPREGEVNGKNYYFVSQRQFNRLISEHKLVEFAKFRDWYYGVPFESIRPGYINIGIFNPQGMHNLQRYKLDYTIVPVYLEEKFKIRMRRAHDREGKWKLEFFRRAVTDFFDFQGLENKVNLANGRWIHLKDVNGCWRQSIEIKNHMIRWHILIEDKETQSLRLGNFV